MVLHTCLLLGFHYNTVGTILMISIPLSLGRAITRGKHWIAILSLLIIALLLTQSRGAIVGAGAGILFYFYLHRKVSVATLSLILVFILGSIWFSDPISALFSLGVENADVSAMTSGRLNNIWEPLLSELFNDPLKLIIGFGLFGVIQSDSYIMASNFYRATHAHNAYLDLLVDGGLIVFLPFVTLVIYSINKGLKWARIIKNPTYYALLSSIFVYLISSFSERQFFPRPDNMMLWPIIALLLVMVIHEKSRCKNNLI